MLSNIKFHLNRRRMQKSRIIFGAAMVAAVTTQVAAEAKLGDMATKIACQPLKA